MEDQSAYWFLKGEMQSRAPLNQMDLEQILEMLQNVPAKEMNEAMEQAEMMGDEAAMIVLVMADNKRKFREEYASEYVLLGTMQSTPADGYNGYMKMMRDARKLVEIGNETGLDQKLGEAYQDESGRWFLPILERKASEDEPSVENLKSYFSRLKSQNPDLARKIEFSVKNYDNLPRKEIEDAGFDSDIIDEWVDYVGMEDENLVEYDQCSDCEGEGIIITKYYPATRYDPPDADFENCEMCFGSGRIDPADYMDYDGNYMAESWQGKSLAGSLDEMDEMLDRKKAESPKGIRDLRAGDKNLAGANLEGADLSGADLIHANLKNANLKGAKLDHANLNNANLSGANLENVYANQAKFRKANFKGANLDTVNFRQADLRGANLEDVKLNFSHQFHSFGGANLRDVIGLTDENKKLIAQDKGIFSEEDWDNYYGNHAEETKSMNPYLLGAGIFALTLGLLSRKR